MIAEAPMRGSLPLLLEQDHDRRWNALIDYARNTAPDLVPVLEEVRRRGAAVDFRPGGQGYRLVPGLGGRWESDEAFRREMEGVIGEHRKALALLLEEFVEHTPVRPPDEGAVAKVRERAAQVSWRIVRDLDGIRRVCAEAREASVCGLDTETTPGEDVGALPPAWAKRAPLDPYLGRIRLVQMAVPGRPVEIIDLSTWWERPDAVAAALRPLQELLADPSVTKVIYNAAFDLRMLRAALGGRMRPVAGVYDPMLAAQLLACGQWPEGKDPFSLEAVAARTLGLVLDKSAQTSNWSGALTNDQLRYAALDAAVLLWLHDAQLPLLAGNGLLRAAALEFECVPATADMVYAGMPFDRALWERLREQEEDALAAAVRDLEECFAPVAAGQMGLFDRLTVNPDSPQQVLSALRALGADIEDTRDTTLALLAQQGGPAGRAAEAVLRYRRHAKRLSAFIEPYLEHVHPKTGRIHAEYRQLNPNGVGRFSSSNPNIQQVVRGDAFRRAFRAPEGRALVIADYAAIEMRIMAWLSGDPTLIEIFRSGADPHRRTASLIMGKPEDQVTKEERQAAKAAGFGLIYGMSAGGLQLYASTAYGVKMTKEEAQRFREGFFKAYAGVARWHHRQDRVARARREIRTASGRARRWASSDMPSTQLYNSPDQGTGADILKRAMARLRPHLMRLGAELVASVHDELVVECDEDRAAEVAEVVKREMEAAGEEFIAPVPVEVEVGVGKTWADKA